MEKKTQAKEQKLSVYPRVLLKPENMFNLKKKRDDELQEELREFIVSEIRFVEWKYVIDFDAIIPERTWKNKKVEEFVTMANELGDGIVNVTRLAFIFAQMLKDENYSDEAWISLANTVDESEAYRLIEFNRLVLINNKVEVNYILVGDCAENKPTYSPTYLCNSITYNERDTTFCTVPWIYKLSKSSKEEVNQEKIIRSVFG